MYLVIYIDFKKSLTEGFHTLCDVLPVVRLDVFLELLEKALIDLTETDRTLILHFTDGAYNVGPQQTVLSELVSI